MKKEEWHRLWMHVPWGMLAALPMIVFIMHPNLLTILFGLAVSTVALLMMIIYEAFNDWRKKDSSYKDVLGIVWGYLIFVTGITVYLVSC